MKLFDYIKWIFLLLIFLQFAPTIFKGIKENYKHLTTERTKVGKVDIKGTIQSSEHTIKHLKTYFKNKSIKAIFLNIESPGGTAGTSQAIFSEIQALKKKHMKPVICFAENVCASGAYYIACAADSIIATPSAFIGSIGVYIAHPQFKEFIEQYNIKYNIIKTGTYKATGSPFLEETPEQRAMLQSLTDDTYNQFTSDVAQNRQKLSLKNVSKWANGKIFTGKQALQLGLIDKVGSLSTVEQEIREKAPIKGEIEWITAPQPSLYQKFFGHLESKSFLETCMTLFMSLIPTHA